MFGLRSMEKRITEKIDGIGANLEAYFSGRIDEVNERLQQSIRQERRNQAALESVFENQKAELSMLRGMRDESQALKALMAFSESFALWLQSAPDTPESRVLRAKLDALLEQFNLSIVAETGIPFDPSFHEACAVRSDPGRPDGYVLEVVRPGFASDGEILRCAAVVVNRSLAPEENETEGLVEIE